MANKITVFREVFNYTTDAKAVRSKLNYKGKQDINNRVNFAS